MTFKLDQLGGSSAISKLQNNVECGGNDNGICCNYYEIGFECTIDYT